LRQRTEDLRLLVDHFIDKYSHERHLDIPVVGVEREVEQLFYKYRWPGNVRELENVIERAMVLCPDTIIKVSDLPGDFRSHLSGIQSLEGIPEDANLFETLSNIEKNMIERALQRCNHVQSDAAQLLGIGKSGLSKKMKKYGIPLDA
jgi:two-component system NtrC family response regulator